MAAATLLVRARYLGLPLIDVDEQFYLLVGDRMWSGALPYVDIWDRKPVGLFLLYAAIRLLGGDGVVQYQLVAAGFAAATAVVIAVLARRIASPGAAIVAALAYAPALAMSGGAGGQTPVFYNLPMALAALLLARLAARPAGTRAVRRHGAAAMLLTGLALQIKYTALFEGLFFGCALIALAWRAAPARRAGLLGDILLWIGLALAPTALAWGAYAALGQGPAFAYANFLSIAARGGAVAGREGKDLLHVVVRLLPFTVPILVGEWLLRDFRLRWDAGQAAAHRVLAGWAAAAAGGFLVFGGYFDHYALPLLPPLAVLAAPTFAIAYRGAGRVFAAITLLAVAIPYPLDAAKLVRRRGDRAYIEHVATLIRPHLASGRCLYVFYGEPILYHLTGSCLPTRWPFPFHLSLTREAAALGTDAPREVARILDARPPVIVDRDTDDPNLNRAIAAQVRDRLARDYRLLFRYKHRNGPYADTDRVWLLRQP